MSIHLTRTSSFSQDFSNQKQSTASRPRPHLYCSRAKHTHTCSVGTTAETLTVVGSEEDRQAHVIGAGNLRNKPEPPPLPVHSSIAWPCCLAGAWQWRATRHGWMQHTCCIGDATVRCMQAWRRKLRERRPEWSVAASPCSCSRDRETEPILM
jgi:hypothetical protein